MDLFNRAQLKRLAELQDDLCISLYMPTHQFRSDWSQNTTRFKNLLGDVQGQLQEQDYRESGTNEILGEARALLDRPGFWRDLSDGLAVFITGGTTETYRLPLSFDEIAITDDHFHLKPLFPLIAANNRFYLLSLSQNDVRLYQGTHQAVGEVEAAEIPSSIVSAIQQYEEPTGGFRTNTQGQSPSRDAGNTERAHHGQGAEDDLSGEPQDEIKRFFRKVDESVSDYLGGEDAPLVLAGVSEYLPLYREANSYPHLIEDEIVAGNPEQPDAEELHTNAWDIVESVFLEHQEEEKDRFEQLYYQDGDLASDDFHEIIPACAYSRVETLFVPVGQHRWGRFDPETNTVEVHDSKQAEDGDLLNYAAVSAYRNGATVHALRPEQMPGGRSIAATFRYRADLAADEEG
jgi:hypothetical protein